MQLLAAHQILIAFAIALAGIFGIRAFVHFSHDGAGGDLVLGVASLVMAVTLGLYFRTVRGRWVALKSAQGQPKK